MSDWDMTWHDIPLREIEHEDRRDDRYRDENASEKQVFAYQRRHDRRARHKLHQQQLKQTAIPAVGLAPLGHDFKGAEMVKPRTLFRQKKIIRLT